MEQLYIDYQKRECNDEESIELLKAELKGKTVLVIGPGSTIGTYRKEINKYVSEKNPTIIAINCIPQGYHPQYLFITNATRYLQSATKLHDEINSDIKIIASSNLTTSDREFDYVINYSSVIDEGAEIPDNSMCMLIRTLIRCECKNVSLAGLDGYTPDNVNYFDIDKEYSFLKDKAESLNDYAKNFFNTIKNQIQVEFVTPSKYQAR